MPYTLVSALAKPRAFAAQWQTVDLSLVRLNSIYDDYQDVYLTLNNPAYTHSVYLDMAAARDMIEVSLPSPTLHAWLAGLGSTALPTTNTPISVATSTVLFRDAWQAGYSIQPISIGAAPDAQLPRGALNDLLVTPPAGSTITTEQMYADLLVSVNGFIHRTGIGTTGLQVQGGMATQRKCDDAQMGLLSFEHLGGITIVPITNDMITNKRGVDFFARGVYVDIGLNLSSKSLLLVLGGHLHCLDEAYSVVGDRVVRIHFDRLPWAQTFFDSKAHIDMSSITWSGTDNPDQIAVADLYSDTIIEAFLQLSQSFFVVVDTPSMYVNRHHVEQPRLPGRWYCSDGLQAYPLIGPMGKIMEYVPVWENTLYVLRAPARYNQNYTFETTDWLNQLSVAPVPWPGKPLQYSAAYLMELGTQVVTA